MTRSHLPLRLLLPPAPPPPSRHSLATNQASGELEGLLPKGLPAWVKARGSEAHNYFVFVEEVNTQLKVGPSRGFRCMHHPLV